MLINTGKLNQLQATAYNLIGERPVFAPMGWEIWNAPRPIACSSEREGANMVQKCWQGDFVHGIFYAAIDPEDEYADLWRQQNINLDAYILNWITLNEAKERCKTSYLAKYKSFTEKKIDEMLNDADENQIRQTLYQFEKEAE